MRRRWWSRRRAAADPAGAEPAAVRGERGVTVARRRLSLQARLNGWLAAGLVGGVGILMLSWYYTHALHGSGPVRPAVLATGRATVGNGARALEPLPPFAPPRAPQHAARRPRRPPRRLAVLARAAHEPLLVARPHAPSSWPARADVPAQTDPIAPAVQALLSGPVFTPASGGTGAPQHEGTDQRRNPYAINVPRASHGPRSRLQRLLRPTVLRATRAQLLPQRRLLLAKGTFIDCTLETAIDSTLPGMTTCITARNTFSADGTVVLLERGTELIGQTRGEVRQGEARVFVIWTEARTPTGVVVRLDSPATDALGRSGLAGTVNTHFWQRFGAALLISTLTAGVQAQAENATGTVVIDPTASAGVLTGVLRSTEDIAPTVDVPSGERIEVLVARDIDFRPVYELVER